MTPLFFLFELVGICDVSKIEHLTLLIIKINISSFDKQILVFTIDFYSALYSVCFCLVDLVHTKECP